MSMTDDDKKMALDSLWYETWMFREAYNKLAELDQRGLNSSQLDFNFSIEIFLLHLRNLIYVLENRKDSRDIRCSDFELKKTVIDLPKENNLEKIDKFLSHLTWDRVKAAKPKWDSKIREMIKEKIKSALDNFIKQLSDNLFPTKKYTKTKKDFYLLFEQRAPQKKF